METMKRSCGRCGGSGVIERPDGLLATECQCAVIRRLAAAMPAHIRHAEVLKAHFELDIVKTGVRNSFYVKSSWSDMKAIIKAVMMLNPSKFIRVTSDRELRDIYVGGTSRTAKGEETTGVYNTLADIMEPPFLCIVRLNELSYKNKAAPGLLEEALSYRLDRDRPTWVVSDLDKPFGRGSFAYSDSVWDLMHSALNDILIPRISPRLQADDQYEELSGDSKKRARTADGPSPFQVERAESTSDPDKPAKSHPAQKRTDDFPAREEPPPRRRIQPTPDEDAPKGLGLYGKGLSGKKTFGRGN